MRSATGSPRASSAARRGRSRGGAATACSKRISSFNRGYTGAMALTPSRRSELRAQAHQLSPVVIIGDKGLTDEVIAEIDRSLKAHELIKVRAAAAGPEAGSDWRSAICAKVPRQP